MSRGRYLAAQHADPAYVAAQAIARAQLELAEALHQRRTALGLRLDEVAQRAGLAPERLEMIEEGDTSSLVEVLQLLRVLDFALTLQPDLAILAQVPAVATAGEPVP